MKYANTLKNVLVIYGMKPSEVVYRLAKGETVRGKNWNEGMFGIGATPGKLEFPDGSGLIVSSETGNKSKSGKNY